MCDEDLIQLENVSLSYPIFGWHGRSIKNSILSKFVGGRIAKTAQTQYIHALNNINISIKSGERIGIIGHNGSGKTTLLKVLSRVYHPSTGVADVKGSINSLVDITYGFDFEASGIENIDVRLSLKKVKKSKFKEIKDSIIDFSELGEYINLPLRTYSSGMVMRLAFALSTEIKSDIVIMDEWLSVGDTHFVEKAHERLCHFIDESKVLIIATHSHALVEKVCNRVIQLDHGIVISDQVTKNETY